MAFTTTPYCTLAQVKNALGLQSTAKDAWIQSDVIPPAQALIDNYCGRTWQTDGTTLAPATRTYDGNDRTSLVIDECQSISQVLETNFLVVLGSGGTFISQGATTVDITADVVLGPRKAVNNYRPGYKLLRITGLPFHAGKSNYVVKGVFGNPIIPNDIMRACIRICTHYVKQLDANYATSLTQQGGARIKYDVDLPADVIHILELYRHRYFASRTTQ